MVDKILAKKEEDDDYLSGEEKPKKPVFQIKSVADSDEETKEELKTDIDLEAFEESNVQQEVSQPHLHRIVRSRDYYGTSRNFAGKCR